MGTGRPRLHLPRGAGCLASSRWRGLHHPVTAHFTWQRAVSAQSPGTGHRQFLVRRLLPAPRTSFWPARTALRRAPVRTVDLDVVLSGVRRGGCGRPRRSTVTREDTRSRSRSARAPPRCFALPELPLRRVSPTSCPALPDWPWPDPRACHGNPELDLGVEGEEPWLGKPGNIGGAFLG